jgi:hypothetical protein
MTKYDVTQGQASWAKVMSSRSKLTALAYHPTKMVKKRRELTYLSSNTVPNEVSD